MPDESDDEDLDDSQSDHSVEMITANAYDAVTKSIMSAYAAATCEDLVIDLAGPSTSQSPRYDSSLPVPCDSQAHIHDVREPANFVEGQDETADDVIDDSTTDYKFGGPVANENLGDRTLHSDDMTDLESNESPNMDVDHAWYGTVEQDDDEDAEQDDDDQDAEQDDEDDYPDEQSDSQMDSLESQSAEDMISIISDGDSHRSEASDLSDDDSLGLESRNGMSICYYAKVLSLMLTRFHFLGRNVRHISSSALSRNHSVDRLYVVIPAPTAPDCRRDQHRLQHRLATEQRKATDVKSNSGLGGANNSTRFFPGNYDTSLDWGGRRFPAGRREQDDSRGAKGRTLATDIGQRPLQQ